MNELARALPLVRHQATRSLLDVWSWGVELRLWVATCVAGLCLFSAQALGAPFVGPDSASTTTAVMICFWATLALYNLDGTLDAPSSSSIPRTRRWLHLGLTLVSVMALIWLLTTSTTKAFWLVLLGALLCGVYAVPLSLRGASTRLKSLPNLKGPFVGVAVGVAVVWVPQWTNRSLAWGPDALLLTSVLALFCTANAILFDIPDVAEDSASAVPTVPARSGLLWTKLVCGGLTVAGLSLSLFAPAPLSLIALGTALLLATWRIDHNTTKRAVAWWVDGALLLPLLTH